MERLHCHKPKGPIVHPKKTCVKHICHPHVVDHIHPSETIYKHHHVYTHKHHYPHHECHTCEVSHQHQQCGYPKCPAPDHHYMKPHGMGHQMPQPMPRRPFFGW
ncbi:hypothetical protein CIB95_07620 [Lottiidibacillus patelloidae]|uniref:Spore coat protein n=1 Tax=Lottiidibacillus patelloidae TaxID=2670334 RepID=A0A263BUB5_9BACI|nr:hypothetical protein CIB95_07620 [Lottiidibacillus patelloidae]